MKIFRIKTLLLFLGISWIDTTYAQFIVNVSTNPQIICPGQTSNVTVTLAPLPEVGFILGGPHSYDFYKRETSGDVLLQSGTSNTISSTVPGNYKVIVRGCSSCNISITKNFDISQPIYAEIETPKTVLCINESTQLQLRFYNVNNPYTYQWYNGENPIPNATTGIYTATLPGTYTLRLSDGSCTVSSNPIVITQSSTTINATATIDATNDGRICQYENTFILSTVSPAGTYNYKWYVNQNRIEDEPYLENIKNPKIHIFDGQYTLKITDTNGCSAYSNTITLTRPSITQSISPPPGVQVGSRFCDSTLLFVGIPPSSGYVLEWYETQGDYQNIDNSTTKRIEGQNSNTLKLKNSSEGFQKQYYNYSTYHVKALDSTGCYNTISGNGSNTQFTLFPSFKLKAYSESIGITSHLNDIAEYCSGMTITLKTDKTNPYYSLSQTTFSYKWAGPNNFTSTSPEPILTNITEAQSGEYSVEVTASGSTCNGTQIYKFKILVRSAIPKINGEDINTVSPKVYCAGGNYSLFVYPFIGTSGAPNSTITGTWTDPNGVVVGTTNSLSINNLTPAKEGNYTFTGSVTGTCPIPNFTITKKVVIATSENVKFEMLTSNTSCENFSFKSTLNIAGPAQYAMPRVNYPPSASNINVQLPLTYPNLGTYTGSVLACGTISKSVTSEIVIPDSCEELLINPPDNNTFATTTNSNIDAKAANTVESKVIIPESASFFQGSTIIIKPKVVPFYNAKTFQWTGPNGFSSNKRTLFLSNASAINQGEYTLISTLRQGASPAQIISKIIISIEALPTIAATITPEINIIKDINTCTGSYADFLNKFSVFPEEALSYGTFVWTGPNNFQSNNIYPLISNIQPNQSGEYTLTATFSGKYTGTVSKKINVFLSPSAEITGLDVICQNGSVALTGNLIDFDKTPSQILGYQWSGPNGFVSTSKNPTVSASGTYNLTINKSGGGCNGSFTTTKTLTQSPNNYTVFPLRVENYGIANPQIINTTEGSYPQGKSFVLKASYPGTVNTYNWFGPVGFSNTQAVAAVFSPDYNKAGVYTITANVVANTCAGGTQNVDIQSTITVFITGCPNTLLLENVSGNIITGTKIEKADKSIAAANQILSGNVIYRANDFILLNPGFKADNGTVFKTEFGGCN